MQKRTKMGMSNIYFAFSFGRGTMENVFHLSLAGQNLVHHFAQKMPVIAATLYILLVGAVVSGLLS
jgi:hypothetical protein